MGEGWAGTHRREALFSLLRGPIDLINGAAAAVLSQIDAECRARAANSRSRRECPRAAAIVFRIEVRHTRGQRSRDRFPLRATGRTMTQVRKFWPILTATYRYEKTLSTRNRGRGV